MGRTPPGDLAVQAVLRTISSEGYHVVPADGHRVPLLVVYRGYRPCYYIDVVMSTIWVDGDGYPVEYIRIPAWKSKYVRMRLPVEIWIVRGDLLLAVVVPEKFLRSAGVVDEYYSIPSSECVARKLTTESR